MARAAKLSHSSYEASASGTIGPMGALFIAASD